MFNLLPSSNEYVDDSVMLLKLVLHTGAQQSVRVGDGNGKQFGNGGKG